MKNDGLLRLSFKTNPVNGVIANITVASISDQRNEAAMQLLEQAPQFLKDLRMLVESFDKYPKHLPVPVDLHESFMHVKRRLEELSC